MSTKLKIYIVVLGMIPFTSCSKTWLDEKPNQALAVPNTISDLNKILENTEMFNMYYPNLGESGTDNYYLTEDAWNSILENYRNIYKWSNTSDFYAGGDPVDWRRSYTRVFYCNTMLEQIEKIPMTDINSQDWKTIKGSALFFRAFSFYGTAQIFSVPYNKSSAETDLGIIIRLSSNLNVPASRSTIQDTYNQITGDLVSAAELLPPVSDQFKTRPSKQAALAILARVYLSMENYDSALVFANQALNIRDELLDYNTLGPGGFTLPELKYNKEVILHTEAEYSALTPILPAYATVDTTIYNMYDDNDLRKSIFFRVRSGRRYFRGNYSGNAFMFTGPAIDELYLISAECNARKSNIQLAMDDLNTLVQTRWANSVTYSEITATDETDALTKILTERRKQLYLRDLRWSDLRRLNRDERFKTSLTRIIDGSNYNLEPSDNRYVYPIPNSEILFNKIPQNPR